MTGHRVRVVETLMIYEPYFRTVKVPQQLERWIQFFILG